MFSFFFLIFSLLPVKVLLLSVDTRLMFTFALLMILSGSQRVLCNKFGSRNLAEFSGAILEHKGSEKGHLLTFFKTNTLKAQSHV